MPAAVAPPWRLLLSRLRHTDDAEVSYDEVLAAGAEPTLLVSEGFAEYGAPEDFAPEECVHGVEPSFDWDTRAKEGLVGVACVAEEPCWPGWMWLPRKAIESVRWSARTVFERLRVANGLERLELRRRGALPIGMLRRRGLEVPVVWVRAPEQHLESICLGLRADLNGDGLIALVPASRRVSFHPRDRVAVIELEPTGTGDLGLTRGLDIIDPDYRRRALEDPMLDLDFVHLRFETRPGERHCVFINGHDFEGFRHSDLKFLRLLLLGAARINGKDDGWIDKLYLRDGDDKDRALEKLRQELTDHPVPGLSAQELRTIIRSDRGTGRIRLGVPASQITLDPSLAALRLAPTSRTTAQASGHKNALLLLRDLGRLAPSINVGDEGAVSARATDTASCTEDALSSPRSAPVRTRRP